MNELSVVIPCMSTVESLGGFMDELAGYFLTNPSDVDIIIVVNQNVAHVGSLIRSIHKKHPWLRFEALRRSGNTRNWGALARFGIAYSHSRYVLLISSCEENDISVIPLMLKEVRQGAQLAQATRYETSEDTQTVPRRFRIYQRLYRLLIRVLLGVSVSDSTYGFKIFDRIFIQAVGLTQNGYSISPEVTLKTILAGGKVSYVSSSIKSSPATKDFKLYQEGIKYIWLLLRGCAHRFGILWF